MVMKVPEMQVETPKEERNQIFKAIGSMSNPAFAANCKSEIQWSGSIPQMKTIKDTAKLFKPYGISEHFIRQKAISGEIVAVKAGCKYLINVDKLTEYLNTHTEM